MPPARLPAFWLLKAAFQLERLFTRDYYLLWSWPHSWPPGRLTQAETIFPMPHFWRSVAGVLSGTAMAQAIPILGSLIIARQYAPAQFGVYVTWLGLVAIAAVVVTGRFETSFAIMEDGEPRRQGVICTLATMLLALAGLSVLAAAAYAIQPGWLKISGPWLFALFVPAVMFAAVTAIWQVWAATEGKYRQLSIMRVFQATSIVILQIAAGLFFPSAETMAAGYVLGALIGLGACFTMLPLGPIPAGLGALLKAFWRRYLRFPLYSLPADAINTTAGQLPILVIASRFGPEVTGLLALAMRTLGAPISLLGASVLDVFKRHAAASYRKRGECRSDYLQTLWVLTAGSVAMCIVLLFSSEYLFALVFGERWRGAGTIAIWMLPMFAMRFVASPLSYMVYIAEKQHVDLIWQICLLIMTVMTLNFPLHYPGVLQSYSAGYTLLYAAYLVMSYRFSLGERR